MEEDKIISNFIEGINSIDDTEINSLSGVTTFNPKMDNPVEILKVYSYKNSLNCSCGKNQSHKNGCLVRFSNGKRGLVGSSCAAEDFGKKWQDLENAHDEKIRKSINERLVKPYIELAKKYLAFCRKIQPKLSLIDDFFLKLDGDVFNPLSSSKNEHGILHTYPSGFGKVKSFPISGYKIISRENSKLASKAELILARGLRALLAESISDRSYADARKDIIEAAKILISAVEILNDAPYFFDRNNLSAIAEFGNNESGDSESYKVTKKEFRIKSWFYDSIYIDEPRFIYIKIPDINELSLGSEDLPSLQEFSSIRLV